MGLDIPAHWLLLIVLFAVVFGSKKIPDIARGFREARRELTRTDDPPPAPTQPPAPVSDAREADKS
jgi:Sec-independent protein translocase protein TatA